MTYWADHITGSGDKIPWKKIQPVAVRPAGSRLRSDKKINENITFKCSRIIIALFKKKCPRVFSSV